MGFQQDGWPAQYAPLAGEYLDMEYPGRWIGRQGSISWPERSPYLTPIDFFYWGCIKKRQGLFQNNPKKGTKLRRRIVEAVKEINLANYSRLIKW
ncbi:uncharacterized protein TNCV_2843741 [Trichonephila clavipes]|nr:uncharacterized protein TNCV_2843741 [Trichonephila clavipes]